MVRNVNVSNFLISIVISTHNRAKSLKRLLDNILSLNSQISFEVVVVDNNSKDETRDLVKTYDKNIKYVFEGNTSFTKARKTGADNTEGNVLLYLDDDVILSKGTLEEVARIFKQEPNCAVAGGKVLPLYEQEPPSWILDLQKSFNGFSLYDLGNEILEVDAVPGPIMAIRKDVFFKIGGFPPDTIGVETNSIQKTFKKLYIGPGDYGLCFFARRLGFKIIYSPKICIKHVIPPFRLTKDFWISRMVGEGHCSALSRIHISGYDEHKNQFFCFKQLLRFYFKAKFKRLKNKKVPLLKDEIWFEYYKALFYMQKVLGKHSELSKYIWELGKEGVSDNNFDIVLSKLPKDYQKLAL